MSNQTIIIFILIPLLLLLSVLLILRVRREKRLAVLFDKLNRDEYSDFINNNINQGTITNVARLFSDLLINSFECPYIVFIRMKKGSLSLNYYHGIRSFKRTDFNLRLSPEMTTLIKASMLPRSVDEIKPYLSPKFIAKLKAFDIDKFFPIFWRDNLYGIYFIKSTIATRHPAFNMLVATIAQSLSAAYHIKWHESKNEILQDKLEKQTQIKVTATEGDEEVSRILKLVKHRKSDTIIARLLESIKGDLDIEEMVYLYQPSKDSQDLQLIKENYQYKFTFPDFETFRNLISDIDNNLYASLDDENFADKNGNQFLTDLKSRGINIIAPLPVGEAQDGLLMIKSQGDMSSLFKRLKLYRNHSKDLVENARAFEDIEALSYTDNLTGLANQRYFIKRFNEEINRAKRYQRNLALVILDVDELKLINDNLGHLAGDKLISRMGNILKRSLRAIDVVARYGGDEFCIIMPESDSTTCLKFMERLQKQIASAKFDICPDKTWGHCTVSMGGAIFPQNGEDAHSLIASADKALLTAKDGGRNQSCMADSPISA